MRALVARQYARTSKTAIVLGLTVLLISACAGEPATAPADDGDEGDSPAETVTGGSDGVPEDPMERLAYLSSLEGEERTQTLIDLAEQESGSVTLYTGHQENEYQPVADAFEDEYGIVVDVFRAGSDDMRVRVLEEHDAGRVGADIIEQGEFGMAEYEDLGILADWDSPEREYFADHFQTDKWVGTKVLYFVAAWNTNLIDGDLPGTYYELVQEIPDRPESFSWETGDAFWFATLVKHFMDEEGLTEEEAIALFDEAAEDGNIQSGHSLQVELLTAGEYAAAMSVYNNKVEGDAADGAPIEWKPAVEPVVSTYNGVGIASSTQQPASALLFTDFLLSRGQELYAENAAVPAREGVAGAETLTSGFEVAPISVETAIEEREKWESIYLDQILDQ